MIRGPRRPSSNAEGDPAVPSHTRAQFALLATVIVSLAGCSDRPTPGRSAPDGPITVTTSDSTCAVSVARVPSGRHTFDVNNASSQVSEVYVYAAGDRIMGEVENVGPSTHRPLIVDLPAGSYQVACKPGMVGLGIRTPLTVTGVKGPPQSLDQQLVAAVASYRTYVENETQALVDTTGDLTTAVKSGDVTRAKAAYPPARLHYERIEPIAESFGGLDPLIDMRADDVTPTTPFAGFHALEQQLFARNSLDDTSRLADALLANTHKLAELVKQVEITPLTMGNGAKSLLDEVAKSKVTGEEERYSRIDLLDFAGNVDGAKYVYSALRPALQARDQELVSTLDKRFVALENLLATHRTTASSPEQIAGSPYQSYDRLTPDQIKALAVEVDTISEPLGHISAVVAGG
jgi:iron uptake system component EfeO